MQTPWSPGPDGAGPSQTPAKPSCFAKAREGRTPSRPLRKARISPAPFKSPGPHFVVSSFRRFVAPPPPPPFPVSFVPHPPFLPPKKHWTNVPFSVNFHS